MWASAFSLGILMAPAAAGQPGRPVAAASPAAVGAEVPGGQVVLSNDERAWVAAHPVVKVGLSSGFPPYYFFDPSPSADGVPVPHGFVVQLMDLWSQRTGLSFAYRRYGGFDETLAAMRAGEIDMTPFTLLGEADEGALVSTRPAFTTNLVLAARRDVPDVSPTANFGGRSVAVEGHNRLQPLLKQLYPQARWREFDDAQAALRAVASGQADLFIGYQHVVVYHVEKDLLANIELRTNLGPGEQPLGPAVRRDAPLLRSILDKAIASISAADRSRLAERWLPAGSKSVRLPTAKAELNTAERSWVERRGRLRVGYDASFAPITLRGSLGDFRGLGADALRLAAGKVGLEIEQERGGSFAEVYAQGLAGDIDVVVGMVRTPQRRADYDFVGPFVSLATALFTRSEDGLLVADTADIGQRKLALLRAHYIYWILDRKS